MQSEQILDCPCDVKFIDIKKELSCTTFVEGYIRTCTLAFGSHFLPLFRVDGPRKKSLADRDQE